MNADSGHSGSSGKAYRLIRPLAELYHCKIHLAEWSGVEGFVKQITVWHVKPELCVDSQAVELLLDGLKSAAALSASTGAQILDVWWSEDQIVFAAEHISGLTMGQAIAKAARSGQLAPLDTVLTVLLEVVHALEQAHDPETRAGSVFHGDLRPDCVLFGYEGTVKVTGFGFASFLPLVNADGGWFTWHGRCYQPAERFYGEHPSPVTDVFSVGAMLLEAATGLIPFGTSDPRTILARLRARQGALLHSERAQIPDDIAYVIDRACAPDPQDRYPSMNDLAADLYRVQFERRRTAQSPPIKLRELLRTLESPSQRIAKAEPITSKSSPSHKSQILKVPRLTKVTKPPPITMPSRPLVGRTEILRVVSQALAGTSIGRGQTILVAGAAGMGKTRLLTEIAVRLSSSQRKLAWVQVTCQSQDKNVSYGAVLKLLASSIGLPPERSMEQLALQADRLRAFGLEATTINAVRGVLGQGIPPEPAHLAGLMSQAMIQCLSSLSWEQTTIVAWDDCHWTDEASMGCLSELLGQLTLIPVVVLLTAPRDYSLPWSLRSVKTIELGPLSTQECEGLILQRLEGAEQVEPRLMEAILERSGGNPSLIEELITLLLESNRLEISSYRVRLHNPPGIQGVPSLREGVQERFKTLSKEVATVAAAAALAGPAVTQQVITRATGLKTLTVQRALEELVGRGVLKARRQGITFPHERLREATLNAAERGWKLPTLRPSIAQAIIDEADEAADGWRDHAVTLFIEAGDSAAAVRVLVEAAKSREARGDLSGAAEHLSRVLELTDRTSIFSPQETLRLAIKAGHTALHSLRLELGEMTLLKAQDIAAHLGDTGAGAKSRIMLSRLLARQGRLKESMDVVQEAIPLAEQSGDPLILAQAYTAIAESYQQWGEYGPDFDYIEPALRLASESGDLLQLGRSLQLAVTHAAGVGEYERTEELLRRGRAIAQSSGDPLLSCQLTRAESLILIFSGDHEGALVKILEGLELAHRNGLNELEVIYLHNAGDAHLRCGRMHEALYYFNESLRRSNLARFDRLTEGNEMYIGYLEATYLQNPAGYERINKATEDAREKGRIWNVTQGHQLMGRALLEGGDHPGARHHLEEALRLAEASGVAFFMEEARRWLDQVR